MGTTILVHTLRNLGFKTYFSIPNRLTSSYGDQAQGIRDMVSKNNVSVFITVDNGISGADLKEVCDELSVKLIVTDHHIPYEDIPQNTLIIDPKYNNDTFSDICGAQVAMKLCYALSKEFRKQFDINLGVFAGIATVADMMPMLNENRYLVKLTLEEINNVKFNELTNSALFKLIRNVGGYDFIYNQKEVATEDLLGFYICPNINAISRVTGDVTVFVSQLLCILDSPWKNMPSYSWVNFERQKITRTVLNDFVETNKSGLSEVFIYDVSNYAFPIKGVLGLVANRLSHTLNKIVLIGIKKNENTIEFSGRSAFGYNLHEGIERIREIHPELNISGGGHANAMGVRIDSKSESVESFKRYLEEDIKNNCNPTDITVFEFEEKLEGEIINTINEFKPFGTGFKNLLFKYSGDLISYDFNSKQAQIGDYYFKVYLPKSKDTNGKLLNESKTPEIIDVKFNIIPMGNDTIFKVQKE